MPVFGRRPVRGRGRAYGSALLGLGHAGRVDPGARRSLSAGDGRVPGSRAGHDAGCRAGGQSVPRRAARVKFSAPRGTHDVLPSEQPFWSLITRTAEAVCELYGYGRLVTPGFEDTGLFERTSGQGSDIVRKEMYTFEDRGGRSLTLRPEGTAPTARAYVEHGLDREPQPFKAYSIAPMYRYDRPQKGRYREHWQFNVEAIGSSDPAIDAEIIQLYTEFLRRLGVRRYGLELNSIGDRNCRSVYLERLEAWLDEHDDALDADARAKRETSPLRVFDTKNPAVEAALADAPKIGESLCAECGEQFAVVRAHLDAYGVSYELRPALVRGLDYYTRTTFEFIGAALRHGLRGAVAPGPADPGREARGEDDRDRGPGGGDRSPCGRRGRRGGTRRPEGGACRMSWRDLMCGEPRAEQVGRRLTLAGWAARRRDHGGLVFIDLRDHTGICQLVVNPERSPEAAEAAHATRAEFVLKAEGELVRRDPDAINPALPTGEVELQVDMLEILSLSDALPFQLEDDGVEELTRLRYRYLDLRRDRMQRNLRLAAVVVSAIRHHMESLGFLDVWTPSMTKATPEGARDFVVPVRLQPGRFFALPQSPQLFKQILMVSGLDRYYQIATCLRDEDLRADRQFEHRQLDVEMAFPVREDVWDVIEGAVCAGFEALSREPPQRPFRRMSWQVAHDRY